MNNFTRYLESPEPRALWCPSWQDHPEAVWRFTALHAEFIRSVEENNESSWWVNHFDRHCPHLFGVTGIFKNCEYGHNPERLMPFETTAVPKAA